MSEHRKSEGKTVKKDPIFQPEEKEFVTPVLEEYAREMAERIEEAIRATYAGHLRTTGQREPIDFSHVANEIWDYLNEMDDSPAGQLINAAIYGVSDVAASITAVIYEKVAERLSPRDFTPDLPVAITDPENVNKLAEPLARDVQEGLDRGKFDGYFQQVVDAPFPELSEIDYLEGLTAEADMANRRQDPSHSSGIER